MLVVGRSYPYYSIDVLDADSLDVIGVATMLGVWLSTNVLPPDSFGSGSKNHKLRGWQVTGQVLSLIGEG